jgi:predicted transcriptional regulator
VETVTTLNAENQVVTVSTWSDDTPKTAEKIAEDFGVTEKTVRNAAKVAQAFEEADEETLA